jgi:hypothetical protein
MNGNGSDTDILDGIEDLDESDDLEMDDELEGEGAEFLPFPFPPLPFPPFGGGGRSRRPQVGGGRNFFSARPQSYFVTQAQLQSALTKVRNDVAKNGRAITAVNTRINGVQTAAARQGRELVKQSKVNARQARDIVAVRTGLKKAQENNLMMFLLTRPKATATAVTNATGFPADTAIIPAGNKILIQPEKDNSLLLALMLSGGLGGDGGDGSSGLLLALALSGGL